MKTLLFFLSFFALIFINQAANAVITCESTNPATSGFFGGSIPNPRSAFFEGLHGTLYGGASSSGFDVSVILGETVTISSFGEKVYCNESLLFAKGSKNVISGHFLNSGDYSISHHSIGASWPPADIIVCLNTEYVKNDEFSGWASSTSSNNQSGIQSIENDVIDIVPSPGAFIMGGIGLGMIGWLRRNRML